MKKSLLHLLFVFALAGCSSTLSGLKSDIESFASIPKETESAEEKQRKDFERRLNSQLTGTFQAAGLKTSKQGEAVVYQIPAGALEESSEARSFVSSIAYYINTARVTPAATLIVTGSQKEQDQVLAIAKVHKAVVIKRIASNDGPGIGWY